MKVRTLLGQSIDVGSLEVGMAMATEVSPTPVIGEDEDYVWSLGGLCSEGKGKKATNEEHFHGLFFF
jgi:hypothetical protein